jgi:hypothetical protein
LCVIRESKKAEREANAWEIASANYSKGMDGG